MIKVINKGSFKNTEKFLKNTDLKKLRRTLEKYGRIGVSNLQKYTPIDSGQTAFSWRYEIVERNGKASLIFHNDNVTKIGITVAILIQYGHATRNGYWIDGIDYINPALRPVFNQLGKDAWEEVNK